MQGNMGPRLTLRVSEFERLMRARGAITASAQATELGVYVSTITRVVAGHVQPSGKFVARACEVLNVDLGDLFEITPSSHAEAA